MKYLAVSRSPSIFSFICSRWRETKKHQLSTNQDADSEATPRNRTNPLRFIGLCTGVLLIGVILVVTQLCHDRQWMDASEKRTKRPEAEPLSNPLQLPSSAMDPTAAAALMAPWTPVPLSVTQLTAIPFSAFPQLINHTLAITDSTTMENEGYVYHIENVIFDTTTKGYDFRLNGGSVLHVLQNEEIKPEAKESLKGDNSSVERKDTKDDAASNIFQKYLSPFLYKTSSNAHNRLNDATAGEVGHEIVKEALSSETPTLKAQTSLSEDIAVSESASRDGFRPEMFHSQAPPRSLSGRNSSPPMMRKKQKKKANNVNIYIVDRSSNDVVLGEYCCNVRVSQDTLLRDVISGNVGSSSSTPRVTSPFTPTPPPSTLTRPPVTTPPGISPPMYGKGKESDPLTLELQLFVTTRDDF